MNEEESILGHLFKQLEVEKEEITNALSHGTARDYAEYRSLAGRIQGLATAQSFITATVDRLRKQLE